MVENGGMVEVPYSPVLIVGKSSRKILRFSEQDFLLVGIAKNLLRKSSKIFRSRKILPISENLSPRFSDFPSSENLGQFGKSSLNILNIQGALFEQDTCCCCTPHGLVE